ncbi:hypothetical protein GCM10011575_39940 [Microlunatus endophyticus]|uniref:DUF1343 domain-containing protein n=1 Tax=Microlunatus endophyticus TaxID=1716077 RepID=A0A917SFD0_9ACTN|nr:DUF1343 domain-containing protein [Microlunatus endophyticus]GGL77709.1 hypothetical protein GCM10011575_39940 [Microlunatus endophyticus]
MHPATADESMVPSPRHGDGQGGDRPVTPGADVVAAADWGPLAGSRLGVMTNPTGILAGSLINIVDAMVTSGKVDVAAVFGPEHGFRGTAQAGYSEAGHTDERTGVKVYDAYGADPDRLQTMFAQAGIGTVVFDIQDVGARFYTYVWTMYAAMIAAVRSGLNFVVLDRPNPIGGAGRGPMIIDSFTSGVGMDKIVQAHGMTAGELARYFDGELMPAAAGDMLGDRLSVIKVKNWSPKMIFADTGLAWVPPSPNMPTPDTALLYPGTCLFEGTNLSEGRGTTRPFELIGAPYVDGRWAEWLNRREIEGVLFREAFFTPTFSKNADQICGGVQVHIPDPYAVDPILVATEMLVGLKALYAEFGWRSGDSYPGRGFDLLTGSARFREQLEAGAAAEEIVGAWQQELADFERRRRAYLLYSRH